MPRRPWGRGGRPWQWAASLLWVGFWTLGGIGAGMDPGNSTSLAAGIGMATGFGLAPAVPFWVHWLRQGRDQRRRRRDQEQERARRDREEVAAERLERLPTTIQDQWRRLEHSRALVEGFAEQGWVQAESLAEVEAMCDRLEALLVADRRTDELGGRTSQRLADQVVDLTELLVALADEAVEHQATLVSDLPVPATLAEAHLRLRATRQAYTELAEVDRAAGSPAHRRDGGGGQSEAGGSQAQQYPPGDGHP